MSSMPWVKLYTEILDDPKLAELTPADKWGFVQLILLAGECDNNGLIEMTLKQISWRLREPMESLTFIFANLTEAGLISYDENSINVLKFSKRQNRPQSVKRGQWNDAQRRHRSKYNDVINDNDMTHTGVILTEESREDKEEDRESQSNDKFYDMQVLIETLTGYPINPNPENIQAINEFIKIGAIESDFKDALAFLGKNGKLARGPSALLGSVKTSVAKRTQKANAAKPVSLEDQGYHRIGSDK